LDAELPVHGKRQKPSRLPRDWQEHSSPGTDKRFSCLEVEPAEDARPEVQATTIEVKGTPARRQESMATKWNLLLLGKLWKTCGADTPVRRFL